MKIKLSTLVEYKGGCLSIASLDDYLIAAIDDGFDTVLVTEEEYKFLIRYAIGTGIWNWDGKTILNLNIEKLG